MESDVSGATSKIVPTDGGRYDVRVAERLRVPVYWDGVASKVRRCSWFFRRSLETQYIPYEEDMALKLEEQYRIVHLSRHNTSILFYYHYFTIIVVHNHYLNGYFKVLERDSWSFFKPQKLEETLLDALIFQRIST